MHEAIIKIDPSVKNPAIAAIYLEGTLDINQAEIIRQAFLSILKKFSEVNITIRNIEKIDISFIQIFHAFLISAKKKDLLVQQNWELEGDLKELLLHAGIEPKSIMNKR